jgi:hypothetical protein
MPPVGFVATKTQRKGYCFDPLNFPRSLIFGVRQEALLHSKVDETATVIQNLKPTGSLRPTSSSAGSRDVLDSHDKCAKLAG